MNFRFLRLAAAALAGFAGCAGQTAATNLVKLEISAYEAWKAKDAKFWDTFLWDRFVGNGPSGRLNKAAAAQEYCGTDCDIRSFALSDVRTASLGHDAALITYRESVHGSCGGRQLPANSWAASIYVRAGDQWKAAFHAASPVVDPKADQTQDQRQPSRVSEPQPAARDAGTDTLLAVEKTVWEAWREHDRKKLVELTASEISFINIFGTFFATKAAALKDWSGTGCNVKSVSLTDAAGTMLSATAGILTFKGAADGTCYGQTVGPIWGTSVYVKDGNTWKWAFGINVPAAR